jgi:hypothetical protein
MIKRMKSMAASALLGLGVTAQAAVVLQVNAGGILTGATGVQVGSATYDVTFVEGTCVSVFGGCDSTSDFTFTTQTDALAAGNALQSSVLVDGPSGNFDSNPELTFGCSLISECDVITPYGLDPLVSNSVREVTVENFAGTTTDSVTAGGLAPGDYDTSNVRSAVWAVWTPAATAVPEPGSLALVALGLAAAGFGARRGRSHADQR